MYIKSLSELIEYLENIKEEHGDVAVYKIFSLGTVTITSSGGDA